MNVEREALRMYGHASGLPLLDWEWVESRLVGASTYWVCATATGQPHPRPVWGVWHDDRLHLSIGSQIVAHQVAADPRVTAHLDSGTDVVIIEGLASTSVTGADVLAAYGAKYGRDYTPAELGDLTCLTPSTVITWRSAGWAGKDGFREAAKWVFS
jgi:hypothetical protein